MHKSSTGQAFSDGIVSIPISYRRYIIATICDLFLFLTEILGSDNSVYVHKIIFQIIVKISIESGTFI